MKINLLTGFLALAVLPGCANMGSFLMPETDPHLVNAEATAKSSEVVVKSFRQYELANRNADLDAKQTARSLETFDEELEDLKTLQKMYAKYRSGENLTRLISQTRQVQAARDRAATAMVGGPVERPPFAPPIGSMPPGPPPFDPTGLYQQLAAQKVEHEALKANMNRLAVRVWELTNTNSAATNAPPPVPGK